MGLFSFLDPALTASGMPDYFARMAERQAAKLAADADMLVIYALAEHVAERADCSFYQAMLLLQAVAGQGEIDLMTPANWPLVSAMLELPGPSITATIH